MTEDIEPFIEEHLAVYRVKHKNKFRKEYQGKTINLGVYKIIHGFRT